MIEQAQPKKTGRPAKAYGQKFVLIPVKGTPNQKAKFQRLENGPQRFRDWLDRVKE